MLWTRNPHEDSRLQQQRCYTDHIVLAKMFESPLIKSHTSEQGFCLLNAKAGQIICNSILYYVATTNCLVNNNFAFRST